MNDQQNGKDVSAWEEWATDHCMPDSAAMDMQL